MKRESVIEICVEELQKLGYSKEYAEKLCHVEYSKLD